MNADDGIRADVGGMRRAAISLAAVAVLGGAGCAGGRGQVASPAAGASAIGAGRAFLERYTAPDGRVRRLDQGDDTVSEGQAYGLLVAAALDDTGRFDAIWGWTRRHLRRSDGLLASHWQRGRVVDPQAATDADLDAARALLVAGCRRARPDLRRAGVALGRAILRRETARRGGRLVLAAGPWATGQPVTVNPSYLAPATLEALGEMSGDGAFERAAADGRALVAAVARPLPPDWATVDAGGLVRPSGPPGVDAPAQYSFDAPRALVRLAEDRRQAGRRLAARAWPVFRGRAPGRLVVERGLDGAPAGSSQHPVALVAAAAAAAAAGDTAAMRRLLDAAQALDRRHPTYYGAAWVALGRLMLTTDRLRPCAR
ncbi:MAG: glycoside hydrolase [Actinobacteria bacterium]|nr:MAG: glycoside hydrolase [Actinomycetota bacterium]